MIGNNQKRLLSFAMGFLLVSFLIPCATWSTRVLADPGTPGSLFRDDDETTTKKKRGKSGKKHKKKEDSIRWGQRHNETDEHYDKRYKRVLKRVRQDKRGDYSGGEFRGTGGQDVRFYTHKGRVFVSRSDISKEFTADLAMYMEMLHREYGKAFSKVLGIPADPSSRIEVIVWSDRNNYILNGGSANSGGYFDPAANLRGDRGPTWPARMYRLVQFTDGITDFARWPKGTLKHEGAHMELQLRLGFTKNPQYGNQAIPIVCPIWWNEGVATNFEYWDFAKSVEENIAEMPRRGRYAPFIRRIHETDDWKDFQWLWLIDPGLWNSGYGGVDQVYLNYCQSWSLVAYMFNGGIKGHRDFRRIYDLTKQVGTIRQKATNDWKVVQSDAWLREFSTEDQMAIEKNWNEWIANNFPRDDRVADEEYYCRCRRVDPSIVDRLSRFSSEAEVEENKKWLDKEQERREKDKGLEF
ncbi:MAG: hypothetical protein ABII12_16615 [Planctomycetota bacterium]